MPLDPSIFLQGAALQQRNNEALMNTFQGISDMALKRKALEIEQATKGFDIEKLAQGYQLKKNMGVPTTPQEKAAFDTFVQFESAERAVDPVTGNLFQKFQWPGASDYRTISEFPQNEPQRAGLNLDIMGPPSPRGALDNPPQQFAGGFAIPPVEMAAMEGLPVGPQKPLQKLDVSSLGQPAPAGFNLDTFKPPITVPPELQNNPKAAQTATEEAIKGNIDLQKKAAETEMGVSAAGAEAYSKAKGEDAANKENTLVSLDTVLSSLDSLEKIIGETPSGGLQSTTAKIGNFLGKPNPQALAQADVDAAMPVILSNVKTVIRQKGEGTFSDADQKLLDRMLPLDSDSTPVKIRKLLAVKKEFVRLKSQRTESTDLYREQNASNPGFKYIGRKQ